MSTSRRHFLRTAFGLAATGSIPLGSGLGTPLALSLAGLGAMSAQSSSAADLNGGYKALVCLYLSGGNDSHNWVVPIDSTGYAEYAGVRRELALPAGGLLPITSTTQGSGRRFGMAQELQPLRTLYEAGRCAVIANVGPLERPVSKAEFAADVDLPAKLFSHNDQASTWQSLSAEGARTGWGGRMGDLLMSANHYPVFTAISATGNAVFLTGSGVTQYQVSTDGPISIGALGRTYVQGSTTAAAVLERILPMRGNTDFQAEYARVTQRATDSGSRLQAALGATFAPTLPTTPIVLASGASLVLGSDRLAQQLRIVAHMIAAAPGLGMRRQVFMVSLGGFDTHSNQMRDQPVLTARVAHSVAWFQSALASLGMQQNVTLFSASDFGRTLTSNGDGSDHGWGSHHLVVGGAVRGKDVFGRFPLTALGTESDVGSGRLLPSTSVTEYAATLGRWMGLSTGELSTVLPNLGNFGNGDLGFV